MKKRKELDVDFVGGQGPLTKEEEKLISEFIRKRKSQRTKKSSSHKTRKRIAA